MKDEPTNICILHFGQLGDVLLALPAIKALSERFADARLTLIAGSLAAKLVDDLKIVDETIAVDRVALLKGNKIVSIVKIIGLARSVRRRRFDFVIDLHSLYETNLLAYFSRAEQRLLANRPGRSLDRLSNFRPKPPREDKSIHLADNYLAVLEPLAIENISRNINIAIDNDVADSLALRVFSKRKDSQAIVGMVIGAGHPSRRWPLGKFAELAEKIVERLGAIVSVFLGPEEENEADKIRRLFPNDTVLVSGLSLSELAAVFTKIDLLVGNDTGPPHLAALVGTPVVLVIDQRAPLRYSPLTEDLEMVRDGHVQNISVDSVFDAVARSLTKKRGNQEH